MGSGGAGRCWGGVCMVHVCMFWMIEGGLDRYL